MAAGAVALGTYYVATRQKGKPPMFPLDDQALIEYEVRKRTSQLNSFKAGGESCPCLRGWYGCWVSSKASFKHHEARYWYELERGGGMRLMRAFKTA